jgi:L-methionine (R)-S-oxide reductase
MNYNFEHDDDQNLDLKSQLEDIIQGQTNFISNISNLSSMLFYSLSDINWAGVYMLSGDELILGPFQGKPACIKIELGKGVCGSAAEHRRPIIVANVHEFPGHIACDPLSKSEMVIPIIWNNQLIGVLDLDSPRHDRFRESDMIKVEDMLNLVIESSDIESIVDYYGD